MTWPAETMPARKAEDVADPTGEHRRAEDVAGVPGRVAGAAGRSADDLAGVDDAGEDGRGRRVVEHVAVEGDDRRAGEGGRAIDRHLDLGGDATGIAVERAEVRLVLGHGGGVAVAAVTSGLGAAEGGDLVHREAAEP